MPPPPNGPIPVPTLLNRAASRQDSPFDYIIVGSGGGGGPLACRLAEAGRRVLVLEAGKDPHLAESSQFKGAEPGEITKVPAYHMAATEDPELSWQFSVRHFADDATQSQDDKYNLPSRRIDDGLNPPADYPPSPRFLDPSKQGRPGKGGVFYPRSSNLGGCTAHHAMILVVPNDRDWEKIAELTGDDSWRAANMRGYFARLERCLYRKEYEGFFRKAFGLPYLALRWLVSRLDPRSSLDDGGHGKDGWQPTSFIDPRLVKKIQHKDKVFVDLLARSALTVIHANRPLARLLQKALFKLRVVQQLDPNDINTRRVSPEGVYLIPIGTQSAPPEKKGQAPTPQAGQRVGVREYLLKTEAALPDRLVIARDVHVTRVLFENEPDGTPRAIGVEYSPGAHQYEASPLQTAPAPTRQRYFVGTSGEVVLCAGAFNTPQLLMLSGIGDTAALENLPADPAYAEPAGDQAGCVLRGADSRPLAGNRRIHLPGVGRNLQDRYEVSVINETKAEFPTLQGTTFLPGNPNDPARKEWFAHRRGLYCTNGGTIAIMRRSKNLPENEREADTFTFGVSAAFRGYYWGWSRELFRSRIGAANDQRNLWSWVILKAYTENNAGSVRLRSSNPFAAPEICFDSFNEAARREHAQLTQQIAQLQAAGQFTGAHEEELEKRKVLIARAERDLEALVDTIKAIRAINAKSDHHFAGEIQPGPQCPDDSPALRDWIKTQAWGHHCSCTCRLGSDRWQRDPAQLKDKGAVLDSRFRVHGVKGLRIVDASVFPTIPGYFILAPLLMVSEKAADTMLNDRAVASYYPPRWEEAEARLIRRRREIALVNSAIDTQPPEKLPVDTVGLALSGGGIRSATFTLGIVQALAAKDRLRQVDLLSTVSGGGFTGGFIGRLYTRDTVKRAADKPKRAQEILSNTASPTLWWLRTNANYLFANGASDTRYNVAMLWRNILAVHVVIGALLYGGFGVVAWIGQWLPPSLLPENPAIVYSPWWWTPLAALGLGVIPISLGYWLAPRPGSYRSVPPHSLFAWAAMLAGVTVGMLLPEGRVYALVGLGILVITWVTQELARGGVDSPDAPKTTKRGRGTIVRNRMTRALGTAVTTFALLLGWVIIDSLALTFATRSWAEEIAAMVAAVTPFLPILRWVGQQVQQKLSSDGGGGGMMGMAKIAGFSLALLLALAYDTIAHAAVQCSPGLTWGWGTLTILTALVFSLALRHAFDFLNFSSLHTTYAARLVRTFLGASNESRVYGAKADDTQDIELAHPEDDVPFDQYHPEASGGPLHFINVCINETVDGSSNREVRERKGISMCVTPHGVNVGRNYFAEWSAPDDRPRWQAKRRHFDGIDADDKPADPATRASRLTALHALGSGKGTPTPAGGPVAAAVAVAKAPRLTALAARPTTSNPHAFHVLGSRSSGNAEVEPLTLGTWIAISGAAFSTGMGRSTSLPLSLLLGIANVRLGYWWDTGIRQGERPGRYPKSFTQKILGLPISLFRMQSHLFEEWQALFYGASRWLWYLSDGGHFENTALYELIRRRVPLMIVTDGGADTPTEGRYQWDDIGGVLRQVRMDFGAQIRWIDPTQLVHERVPDWIQAWLKPNALGKFDDLKFNSPRHAALGRVSYDHGGTDPCWLLVLKPGVSATMPEDVRNYQRANPVFPQHSTTDQLFDDAQWESYRKMGEAIGASVFK